MNVRQLWTLLGIDKCCSSSLPITEQMLSIFSPPHAKVRISEIKEAYFGAKKVHRAFDITAVPLEKIITLSCNSVR